MDNTEENKKEDERRRLLASRAPVNYTSISINSSPDDSGVLRNAAIMSRYKYYSRLAPHADSPMVMPEHVVPSEVWTHIPVTPVGQQSSLITIFSIWNTMMGTSLLSMPWALGQSGFALGIVLLIGMAALTLYTSYRVMKSVDGLDKGCSDVLEFSDVCRHFLGRAGEICSVVFSVITLLGGAIVYWVLMSNFLYNVVLFIYNKVENQAPSLQPNNFTQDEYITCSADIMNSSAARGLGTSFSLLTNTTTAPPVMDGLSVYWDMQKTVPFFLLVALVPLINFKSPTFFTKFNALGTISVMYLLGFVTYKAFYWGINMDFSRVTGSFARPTFPALTGVLALAYFIHNCILSIVRNQAKPENNGRDLTIAFVCVAVTYTYVAAIFYAAWPMKTKACIEENLLNNLLNSDPLAFTARICLFLQMVTVFPLLLYIMRIQVMHTMFAAIWPSWKHVVVLNILVVGICLIFARFYPHIGDIIRFIGAFCGLVYAFFLPCMTYLLSERAAGRLTLTKLVSHVLLIAIGLANFVAQFFLK